MTLYLHMDGVDDRILIPSMTMTLIEMEITSLNTLTAGQQRYWSFPFGAAFLMRNTGLDEFTNVSRVTVNEEEMVNKTAFIPLNQRVTVKSYLSSAVTQQTHIFNNNGNTAFVKGDIFRIKIYNSTVLMADYDMSTGTVQDQSGNGRHATLFGGTWLDDGQGGNVDPEPIPLSVQFQTKQTIFKPTSDNINTKQIIYKTASLSANTKQAIYKTVSLSTNTKQTIYKDVSLSINTKQTVYKRSITDFPTQQIITELTGYFVSFATKQVIYKQSQLRAPIQQNIFMKTTSNFKTVQEVFNRTLSNAALKQVIYKRITENTPIQIRIFIPNIPDAPEIVGTIHLQGKRKLFISLQGKREIVVFMKGGLSLIPNQNFNMVSGDTKNLIIDIKENLVGASVKWALSKPGTPEIALIKEGNVIDGKIDITLDKSDTEELSGIYKHECEVTDQEGNVSTVMSGSVVIIKDMI